MRSLGGLSRVANHVTSRAGDSHIHTLAHLLFMFMLLPLLHKLSLNSVRLIKLRKDTIIIIHIVDVQHTRLCYRYVRKEFQ